MIDQSAMWAPKPEVFQAIPPDAVEAFLVRRGWVRKPSAISLMRYYEHSEQRLTNGKPAYYYFPDIDTSAEYPDTVRRFVENHARYYELDPYAVLTELQGGPVAEPVQTSVPA